MAAVGVDLVAAQRVGQHRILMGRAVELARNPLVVIVVPVMEALSAKAEVASLALRLLGTVAAAVDITVAGRRNSTAAAVAQAIPAEYQVEA